MHEQRQSSAEAKQSHNWLWVPLDSCYNDSFIHYHIKLGELHKIQGPMQSREKVRILPICTIWNQSWWSREQGKIRGFPKFWYTRRLKSFKNFLFNAVDLTKNKSGKISLSLLPTRNANIKISERAIRMGDCAEFNCIYINLK